MCIFNDACDFKETTILPSEPRPTPSPLGRGSAAFSHTVSRLYFERGALLFHQGDSPRGAFHLSAGLVALERIDEDGQLVVLKVLRPSALFPCADFFAGEPHGCTARALSAVHACFIPQDCLLAALEDTESRTFLLRACADEAKESENTIFRLCTGDLSDQVIATLHAVIEVRQRHGTAIHGVLPMCWRDIAAMVGSSPEVISRTVRKLVRSGRLNVEGRTIVLNPARDQGQRHAL